MSAADEDLTAIAVEVKTHIDRVLQGSVDESLDKLVLYSESENVACQIMRAYVRPLADTLLTHTSDKAIYCNWNALEKIGAFFANMTQFPSTHQAVCVAPVLERLVQILRTVFQWYSDPAELAVMSRTIRVLSRPLLHVLQSDTHCVFAVDVINAYPAVKRQLMEWETDADGIASRQLTPLILMRCSLYTREQLNAQLDTLRAASGPPGGDGRRSGRRRKSSGADKKKKKKKNARRQSDDHNRPVSSDSDIDNDAVMEGDEDDEDDEDEESEDDDAGSDDDDEAAARRREKRRAKKAAKAAKSSSSSPSKPPKRCQHCDEKPIHRQGLPPRLMVTFCKRCELRRYTCSSQCQKRDWHSQHSKQCKKGTRGVGTGGAAADDDDDGKKKKKKKKDKKKDKKRGDDDSDNDDDDDDDEQQSTTNKNKLKSVGKNLLGAGISAAGWVGTAGSAIANKMRIGHSPSSATSSVTQGVSSMTISADADAAVDAAAASSSKAAVRSEQQSMRAWLAGLKSDMSRYCDAFVDEGFDSLAALATCTEEDLTSMSVKRGHVRLLLPALEQLRKEQAAVEAATDDDDDDDDDDDELKDGGLSDDSNDVEPPAPPSPVTVAGGKKKKGADSSSDDDDA